MKWNKFSYAVCLHCLFSVQPVVVLDIKHVVWCAKLYPRKVGYLKEKFMVVRHKICQQLANTVTWETVLHPIIGKFIPGTEYVFIFFLFFKHLSIFLKFYEVFKNYQDLFFTKTEVNNEENNNFLPNSFLVIQSAYSNKFTKYPWNYFYEKVLKFLSMFSLLSQLVEYTNWTSVEG